MDYLPTTNSVLAQRIADFSSIVEALDYAAKGETGACFYDSQGRLKDVICYSDLRRRAIESGIKLRGTGLCRGDVVAIVAETTAEFLSLFYGCQYAGLLASPLPFAVYPGGKSGYTDRLAAFVHAGGAKLLCLPDALFDLEAELKCKTGVKITSFARLQAVKTELKLDPLKHDELAYVQFSSGSTAQPKGILISQAAVTSNVKGILKECIEINPYDRAFSWLPFYHDMGLVGFSIAPLFAQTTVDYLSPSSFSKRPLLWLQLISQNRSTVTYSPIFGYRLVAQRLKSTKNILDLSSIRVAGVGGDMIVIEQLNTFIQETAQFGFSADTFMSSYGLAESTLMVTHRRGVSAENLDRKKIEKDLAVPYRKDSKMSRSYAVCGKPLKKHELKISGPDGATLADRQIGRILVRGPSLMSGYLNPILNGGVDEMGFLDTGDAGFMRDGELIVTGRYKDMIAFNGRNIWPQDIEQTVLAFPDFSSSRVATFTTNDEPCEMIIILIECRNRDNLIKLKSKLASVLSKNIGITANIVIIRPGSLPLTSSGKINLSEARNAYMKGHFN